LLDEDEKWMLNAIDTQALKEWVLGQVKNGKFTIL
jgi:hypothetical protein